MVSNMSVKGDATTVPLPHPPAELLLESGRQSIEGNNFMKSIKGKARVDGVNCPVLIGDILKRRKKPRAIYELN
jgi:hypothetical protein